MRHTPTMLSTCCLGRLLTGTPPSGNPIRVACLVFPSCSPVPPYHVPVFARPPGGAAPCISSQPLPFLSLPSTLPLRLIMVTPKLSSPNCRMPLCAASRAAPHFMPLRNASTHLAAHCPAAAAPSPAHTITVKLSLSRHLSSVSMSPMHARPVPSYPFTCRSPCAGAPCNCPRNRRCWMWGCSPAASERPAAVGASTNKQGMPMHLVAIVAIWRAMAGPCAARYRRENRCHCSRSLHSRLLLIVCGI